MASKRDGVYEKGPDRPLDPVREVHAQTHPLDLLRIDCIRAALAEGTYVVDPRRIADKLLKFERGLPRS
jgi:flagellar biosynthesis anti-sigma factor FlgM